MRLKKLYIIALSVVMLGACNKKLDELLVNPNSPSPDKANADLYLTQMQLSFANFFDGASGFGMEVTRMIVMYGPTYNNAYSPQSFDGLWSTAYTGVIKHANALIPIAESEKKYVNVAMAKTLKAYTMITLVDMFGDIPFTEANLGADNTNPVIDKGADVYAKAITLLDESIALLGSGTPLRNIGAYPGTQDLFYNASDSNSAKKWRTAAKLMKLRALANTRLVDASAKAKIETLLSDSDVAGSTAANDFEFKYSSKQTNPNSRHPRYNGNYVPTGSAGDYMGTYLMWVLVQERGTGNNNDPRTRYYFYRQRTNYAAVNVQTSSCSVAPPPPHFPAGMPYCLLLQGYWGRDHGDNSGIPPDGNLRTTWGIYPAGGEFDANQGTSVTLNRGGNGAGIQPIWQSAFTDFLRSELALKLALGGNPRIYLESGIRKSLAKVIGFPATVGFTPTATLVPDQARLDAYVAKTLAEYDAATSDDERLNVIMREYYIALWGNGIDANNNYRRTGMPNNMQLTRTSAPGSFTRSMLYPSNLVNLNQNAEQKSGVDVRVFWDNNPPGFIK